MVGNNCRRSEPMSHGGKSNSTVGFPARLASRHPSIGISTKEGRPEAACPMDGSLEARPAGNPTVENDFPSWEMVSHRGKWFPTVRNQFPLWEISFATVIPYCFDRIFRPYEHFPEARSLSSLAGTQVGLAQEGLAQVAWPTWAWAK